MSSPSSRSHQVTRTKWHWLIGGAIGALLAVVASIGLWALTDRDGGERTGALWLFGFSTVRVDPDGDDEPRRLDDARGFGAVAGGEGAVYMYDAPSGRVGRLDATTNRLRAREAVAGWPSGDRDGLIATSGTGLWIVTGPGELARVDRDSLEVVVTAELAPSATRTWIAAEGRSVFALVDDGTTLELVRIDADRDADGDGTIAARASVGDVEPLGAIQTVNASSDLLWIVGERGARAFTPDDLAAQGDVTLSSEAGAIRASLAVGRELWLVAQNGAVAYRVTLDREARQVALLSAPPVAFRGQVDLAAGDGEIYALAPAGETPDDRAAVVRRIDPDATTIVESVRAPAELFVGAIATTH